MNSKLIICLAIIWFNILNGFSQDYKNDGDSIPSSKYNNWFNLDPDHDKIQGISSDRAYGELLKGKTLSRVVVAVIDGGVDIKHKDLKNRIWINKGEIPGNGIDDDKNGYIDDVNGWDFIGGAKDNIHKETLEVTRLFKKYSDKFKTVDTLNLTGENLKEFEEFKNVRKNYLETFNKANENAQALQGFGIVFNIADSLAIITLNKKDYTLKDIKKIRPGNSEQLMAVKKFLKEIYKKGFTRKEYFQYKDQLYNQINYQYNTDFNPRTIVGDNPEVWPDTVYGNNDVTGGTGEHGTFVAGVIAAERNNNIGVNGINDSVKIMSVRCVPDGDERDKDVANAIIYAVNNGAQILNLSFGKTYSPQKQFVDSALKLAQAKGVLIVHAAGNDAKDVDVSQFYPQKYADGTVIMDNWINVGASYQKLNKEFTASFTNYGKKNVDIFAPGVNICSTWPNNRYYVGDGTSFACPMVAGAAALIKSVYPSLTAAQIKEILMKSSRKIPSLKVYLPKKETDKKKMVVEFGSLSVTGGILNVYDALKLAGQYIGK
jgi:subtilisin family serine protease